MLELEIPERGAALVPGGPSGPLFEFGVGELHVDVTARALPCDEWGEEAQSGRPDLNRGPHRPERCALPGCATPREERIVAEGGGVGR
jgi:hypothetical protein